MTETARDRRPRWRRLALGYGPGLRVLNGICGVIRPSLAALTLLLVPALANAQTVNQNGQSSGFVVRPLPGTAPSLSASAEPPSSQGQTRPPGLLGVPAGGTRPQPSTAVAPLPGSAQTYAPMPNDASAAGLSSQPGPASGGQTRRLVLTLHQLGAIGPLTLRGTSPLQGVQFGVRADEVVTAATLNLSGAMSPALLPEYSNDTVTLNEQYVGTIPVDRDHPRFDNLVLPISPVFFQDNNRLNFRFTGRYTPECNDPLSGCSGRRFPTVRPLR